MPVSVSIPHEDGSTTIIEQGPSGDYHVFDEMPDGSPKERAQIGSGRALQEVANDFRRPDDPDNVVFEIPHNDGSTTIIEQDPSGDYHVMDEMPDGSKQEREQAGSGRPLGELIEQYQRPDDALEAEVNIPLDPATDEPSERSANEAAEPDANEAPGPEVDSELNGGDGGGKDDGGDGGGDDGGGGGDGGGGDGGGGGGDGGGGDGGGGGGDGGGGDGGGGGGDAG